MRFEVHLPSSSVKGTLNMAVKSGDVRNFTALSRPFDPARLSSSCSIFSLSSTIYSGSCPTILSQSMTSGSVLRCFLSSNANSRRVSFSEIQRNELFGLAAVDCRKEREAVSWKTERGGWVSSRSHNSAAYWRRFAAKEAAKSETDDSSLTVIPDGSVSVILLAGGKGKRMGANMPKQYLPLLGQPIALYSFHTFSSMAVVGEIIVVCDPSYRDIFEEANISTPVKFALPGKERQDSVWNGLQEISETSKLTCIHDSARPLVGPSEILKVINDAWTHGAAVLGVPCKATIKEAGKGGFVKRTLDRKMLWEMQTPQVIEPMLLRKGFELVEREGLAVTDDVSIVEYLEHPVLITEGCYTNLKVTTPDDLLVAERILHQREESD